MLKKAFCAGALAAVCGLANATTPTHWNFSWRFFFDTLTLKNIDATVNGSFDGKDLNSNGVIDREELTALTLQGRDVLGCVSNPPVVCGVSEFSYSPGGTFTLRGNYVDYWDDNGGPDWSWHEISMDTTMGVYSMNARAQQSYDGRDWMFIPETQFTISAVPEPEAYLMFLAGLFVVGAAKVFLPTGPRRRQRGGIHGARAAACWQQIFASRYSRP